uniref:Uncharacterized protein n=1 Tax=Tanacetum cinerariifolium TaxID=118510 RepID=A0A6L2MYD8_TANCI|nr:hypothetical protein [Tanacetum cinerariifolium]
MDKALIPHARRLRIGRSNFHLLSDISSKESTLQLVYDVLHPTPFFKAFFVTTDVLEIYMQEFWATATVHHHSIRFKMDNKKHIVNLESFREMLHIYLRLHVIINKCLTGKSSGYDSLRLSQAQILWGLYHKRNVDFAYLIWEDFVYQVEHKDTKKRNEMYYPRFTRVIIHHFMSKDPSIPKRNKVNWHYVRDDHIFTTIKLQTHISQAISSGADEGTGSIPGVPDVPTGESDEDISWKSSDEQDDDDQEDKGDDDEDDQEEGSDDEQAYDKEDEEFIHPSLSTHEEEKETRDEESFDPIPKTPENTDDEGNGEENLGTNVGREEGHDEEDEEDELYRDVNINLGRGTMISFTSSRKATSKAPHSIHRRYVTASGSRKADKFDSQRMICFQRLSLNVYKKHRNPKAYGRPSTRCRKLPEEAQPNMAGYNKDKQNRLMRMDEFHKFSDGTLTDVRAALDDRLKGIQMKYLP